MGGNDAGHMNDDGALRVGQSYAQPPTPSERCNNLRAKNRALAEENEKLRAELARWYEQPKGDHMPDEFKTGDLVRLRSGGPLMTVRNRKAPSGQANAYLAQGGVFPAPATPSFERPVNCDWFGIDEIVLRTSTFEEDQLKKVEAVTP